MNPTIIPRNQVITALARLRQEWELTANGESLVDIDASVGLLLTDVGMAIGLTPMEQIEVFGADLVLQLQGILEPGEHLLEIAR